MIVRAPFMAFGLLTILPLPRWATDGRDLGRAAAAFPVVGALVGAIVALVDLVFSRALASNIASVLDIACLALVTGGMHLDGLADTADGLAAGPDRPARLAAMRDSRIGAAAASALVLTIVLEVTALSSIVGANRIGALIGALAVSRWCMAVALRFSHPARPDGLGAAFSQGTRAVDLVIATVSAFVIVLATGMPLIATFAMATAVVVLLSTVAKRRFGGGTGDVYGAIGELGFAGALVVASAA